MSVQVSAPTVQEILEEHGLGPPSGGRTWEAYTSVAKDAPWARDFFVVRTLRGELLQVVAVIDLYTRELLTLCAYDGWDVDSAWTILIASYFDLDSMEPRRGPAPSPVHGLWCADV